MAFSPCLRARRFKEFKALLAYESDIDGAPEAGRGIDACSKASARVAPDRTLSKRSSCKWRTASRCSVKEFFNVEAPGPNILPSSKSPHPSQFSILVSR